MEVEAAAPSGMEVAVEVMEEVVSSVVDLRAVALHHNIAEMLCRILNYRFTVSALDSYSSWLTCIEHFLVHWLLFFVHGFLLIALLYFVLFLKLCCAWFYHYSLFCLPLALVALVDVCTRIFIHLLFSSEKKLLKMHECSVL